MRPSCGFKVAVLVGMGAAATAAWGFVSRHAIELHYHLWRLDGAEVSEDAHWWLTRLQEDLRWPGAAETVTAGLGDGRPIRTFWVFNHIVDGPGKGAKLRLT